MNNIIGDWKYFILLFILNITLQANVYISYGQDVSATRELACKNALNNAYSDALSQSSVLVKINSSDKLSDLDANIQSKTEVLTEVSSMGILSRISYNEVVTLTKGDYFHCSVDAKFKINDKELKELIYKYLLKVKKTENKEITSIWQEDLFTIDDRNNYQNEIQKGRVLNFHNAKKYCKKLNMRLPTTKELNTLKSDYCCDNNKCLYIKNRFLKFMPFTDDKNYTAKFWSNTVNKFELNESYISDFTNKNKINPSKDMDDIYFVMCHAK